mgnify:CR=1 FL=1
MCSYRERYEHLETLPIAWSNYSEKFSKIVDIKCDFILESIQVCSDKLHWNIKIWFGLRGQWRSYSH